MYTHICKNYVSSQCNEVSIGCPLFEIFLETFQPNITSNERLHVKKKKALSLSIGRFCKHGLASWKIPD